MTQAPLLEGQVEERGSPVVSVVGIVKFLVAAAVFLNLGRAVNSTLTESNRCRSEG